MNSPVKSFRIERFGQQMEPGRAMPAALNHLPLRASEREAIAAALQAGNGLRRAAIELAAVVADTCRAANAILAGAEEIDFSGRAAAHDRYLDRTKLRSA